MAFDPDEYLAERQEGFNPDQFIAEREGSNQTVTRRQMAFDRLQAMQELRPEEPGFFQRVADFFTGRDRQTVATQTLPEFGQGGLLADQDPAAVAAISPVLLSTPDPVEMGQILEDTFPKISVTQDEKGNVLAANRDTGTQVVLNQPGASRMDLYQTLGLTALFMPTSSVAGMVGRPVAKQVGRAAAKDLAKTAGKRAAAGAVASGVTQTGIEAAQSAAGGEFNPEDVAIVAGLGGAAEGAIPAFRAGRAALGREVGEEAATEAASAGTRQFGSRGNQFESMFSRSKEEMINAEAKRLSEAIKKQARKRKSIKEIEEIAGAVDPDRRIMQAADELGPDVADRMLASHSSNNPNFRAFEQSIKSIPASQAKTQEKELLQVLAVKSDDFIQKFGGDIDVAGFSTRVKDEMLATVKAMDDLETPLYNASTNQIRGSTRVQARNTIDYLNDQVAEMGGEKFLEKVERDVLRKLSDETQPTFARLNKVRQQLGAAIGKREGDFKDADTATLKRLFARVADDQEDAIQRMVDAGELPANTMNTYRSAKNATMLRKSVEENMQDLFGKQLDKSLENILRPGIQRLSKGDLRKFNEIIEKIPESMREDALMTGLHFGFSSGSRTNPAMSVSGFANWFKGLNRNQTAKRELYKHLPPEARRELTNFGRVAMGIQRALQDDVKTGAVVAQQVDEIIGRMDGMIGNLFAAGRTAATMQGNPVTSFIAGQALTKDKTAWKEAATELLQDPKFQQALRKVASQQTNTDQAMKSISQTGAFKRYLRTVGPETARTISRVGFFEWLEGNEDE